MFANSLPPDIPEGMFRHGRPLDPEFDSAERLFYRFEGEYALGASLRGLQVRSPDFSVNREKHGGLAAYVLIPNWLDLGIAAFTVSSIPGPATSEGEVTFSWRVEHVPEENNYHHSEIHTFKSGVKCTRSAQVSDTIKKGFRQALAEKMEVIKICRKQAS